jgi:hypothetical protein
MRLGVALACFAFAARLGAQETAKEAKQLPAQRIQGDAPVIDGRLGEEAWSQARFVNDFEQKGADRGYPVRERTEVAFLYDDHALYIGARMQVSDLRALRAPRSARDVAGNADRLIVSLDTYRNRQTAYNFGVTAGGTRLDFYQPQDVFESRDWSYDPVWTARTALENGGWTAEMRIPFSSLRFHDASLGWGVNIQRMNPQSEVYAFWVVVPANETGWSSRFGQLVGLDGVRPARRFAIIPYGASQRVEPRGEQGSLPAQETEESTRYGGDLLLDLTASLALEATFNPDFGQIEADPAQVNLTAFEIFLPEKRPFFLEGAQLLQGPGPRYYYSRRIGAPPHGDVDAESDPQGTTIPGAVKVIGRLRGGTSLGLLLAASDQETLRLFDPDSGELEVRQVEPQTFFGVMRLQRDLGAGSTFGFVGTGVRRDLGGEELLSAILPRQAFTGGVDWNLRFASQTHEFAGFLGGSLVEGDAAAISRLQTSSARYYQRPDADYVEFDPKRTELSGYTGGLRLGRINGPWRWSLSGEARSPGFELNDAGAMATADDLVGSANIGYGAPIARGPIQRVDVSLGASSGWNFGGERQFTTPALDISLVTRNFWRTYLRVAHDTRSLSDDLTRGGPLMGTGEAWRERFGLSSNYAKRGVFSLDGYYGRDEFEGLAYGAFTRFLYRLSDHLNFSIAPGFDESLGLRQFFTSGEGGSPETFGTRYVFVELDQQTYYARLRAGIAFHTNLNLDLYLEPFASSGRYDRFGELVAARSSDLLLYGTEDTTITRQEDLSYLVTDGDQSFVLENGDFDALSYRANAVLRWDYMQGSSFYLVWSSDRGTDELFAEPLGYGDLWEARNQPGQDVFAVKLSLRLGPR